VAALIGAANPEPICVSAAVSRTVIRHVP
jgi:hypothetical protein